MFEWSASRPGRFTLGEKAADTYRIEGCVGRRVTGFGRFRDETKLSPGRE